MSTDATPRKDEAADDTDPFRYGWRYVKRVAADGSEDYDQIPLSLEDLLFPEEGDHHVETPAHRIDCNYLLAAFQDQLAHRTGCVVVSDCRIDWGTEAVRPMGPDVAVFFDAVEFNPNAGTFYVADAEAKPALVVEVASPETRSNDVGPKMELYPLAEVPFYAIADTTRWFPKRVMRLLGYKLGPDGYEPVPLDDQGRLWLEPVGLWLALGDQKVLLQTPDGQTIGDYRTLSVERTQMRGQLKAAGEERDELVRQIEGQVTARQLAERKAKAFDQQAQTDRQAREALERELAEKDARMAELLEQVRKMQQQSPGA